MAAATQREDHLMTYSLNQVAQDIYEQEVLEGPPPDWKLQSFSRLISALLLLAKHRRRDLEMMVRAELKSRFRLTEEQINTELFNQLRQEKVGKVTKLTDSVCLAQVDQLDYLMEGWIPKADLVLSYGPFGTGKTTLMVWKAYNYAKGINILDRTAPCTPGKSLIIATDSGAAALKKSLLDLGIDIENDPIFQPGHPDQMIWIWAYAPEQGHSAWICDIHGVIQLDEHIDQQGITYVAIDSAKSVSSAAGWSYTQNESVKALLRHLRECICTPYECCLEFLSHDGTAQGAHAGAKAWAEDPSMVYSLSVAKDPEDKPCGVTIEFKKDRAAHIDQRRSLTYSLDDQRLVLRRDVEIVGNCSEAITAILWDAYQSGCKKVQTKAVIDEAYTRFQKSSKTVRNTLGSMSNGRHPKIVKPSRGWLALAPAEIQRLQRVSQDSLSYRGPYESGGIRERSQSERGFKQCPDLYPDRDFGTNETSQSSRSISLGHSSGQRQIPFPGCNLDKVPPEMDGLLEDS